MIKIIFKVKKNTIHYKETLLYKKRLEYEWKTKRKDIEKHIKDIMKIKLNVRCICYVVHEKLNVAYNLKNNIIIFGFENYCKNFCMIYLVHKVLHYVFPMKYHAIIQLIADNELRLRMNEKEEYFYINKNKLDNEPLCYELYDKWINYLEDKEMNINTFIENNIK